jgi:hypothetical protein
VELIFHVIMSRLKPISLSNFVSPPVDNPANSNANDTPAPACPPVTGWRGNYGPVRNNFDDSGFFRGRTDSASKRRRTETQAEIDAAYDLSRDFLTNNPPPKPVLDPSAIKEVLVTATALVSNVKPILEKPDTSEDMKNIVGMMMVMLTVLEAVVEKGIEPLSAAVTGIGNVSSGRPFASAARRLMNPPPPTATKPAQPGRKELVDALKKSELESVIFGANLGPKPVSNRSILNNCFSADLDRKTRERAAKDNADTAESLRLVEDALSCVEQIEFLGGRSKPYVNNRKSDDPLNNTFNTMPVKVIFEEKQARINFELTLRDYSGLRAVQSYPPPSAAKWPSSVRPSWNGIRTGLS